jgi:hypothetical protein
MRAPLSTTGRQPAAGLDVAMLSPRNAKDAKRAKGERGHAPYG